MLYLDCVITLDDWLIDYWLFNILLRHHYRWRAAKFRPMLGAQGLWSGRDLYPATPAATRGLGFSGLIRRTAPFSRLLQHISGCGGSILPRILTGPLSVTFYDTQGDVEDLYSNPDPHGALSIEPPTSFSMLQSYMSDVNLRLASI